MVNLNVYLWQAEVQGHYMLVILLLAEAPEKQNVFEQIFSIFHRKPHLTRNSDVRITVFVDAIMIFGE